MDLCKLCQEDAEFNEEFQHSVDVSEGKATLDDNDHGVELVTRVGYSVAAEYCLYTEQHVKAACDGYTPKELGLKLDSIPMEDGTQGQQRGILIRAPSSEPPKVTVFTETFGEMRDSVLASKDCLRQEQPKEALNIVVKKLQNSLASTLKSHATTMTLDNL